MNKKSSNTLVPAAVVLDHVIQKHGLKNDAALSRFLEVAPPVISKLRHGLFGMSGDFKIRLHFKTGMSIADIHSILGVAAS